MHFWVRKNGSKYILSLLGGIFLFSITFSSLFPESVQAQVAGGAVFDAPAFQQRQVFETNKKVELSVEKAITASVLSSAVQGASYFMRKLAYDAAVYVATGDKGQNSLIYKQGWGSYLKETALNSVGKAVEELGAAWGLNLCKFPNVDLQLYLQIGLRQMAQPTTSCEWNDLKNTYKDYKKAYYSARDVLTDDPRDNFSAGKDLVLQEFSRSLRVENTDFGIIAGAVVKVDRITKDTNEAKSRERLEGGGFKPLQDLISGNVKTPGGTIKTETEKELSAAGQQELSFGQLGSIYGAGALEIIPQTAAMFLNTLTNQLLQRVLTQGLVSGDDTGDVAYFSDMDPSYQNSLENVKAAFGFLSARVPTPQNNYPIVAEYAACPDNPGINNCVMDSGLQDALARSGVDTPITIAEALKQGYLNPNWPLISPRREREHTDIQGCFSEKYCYSNIQKLRKARILPLGFEIAALRSDPDVPWTLGDVVRGFDDCNRPDPNNPRIVQPDPSKPFCHLINPNWVLKSPTARCEAKVIGDQLTGKDVPTRKEECADLSTCLAKDDKGVCIKYGYCTKEKNVWRIAGDVCPAEYSTCTTYTNQETKKIVSYLSKTVDYGQCSVDNVGCRAYSLTGAVPPNAQTITWRNSASVNVALKSSGNTQVAFFNQKIQNLSNVCSAENNGCSAFYPALRFNNGQYFDSNTSTLKMDYAIDKSQNFVHIQKAPDYLGCYDADRTTSAIEWPQTLPEVTLAGTPLSCNNFASACIADEVGCEAFKPADGGPTIPGKIGNTNFCAKSCVGYETFKQEATVFNSEKFPLYFIPTQADSCPALANGCSEFTNIDAKANGGEGLEYYTDLKYCEKPNGNNIKTFYTWEGSASNGYTILTHKMKPLSQAEADRIARPGFGVGSPAYVLENDAAIENFRLLCNEANYNTLLQDPNAPGAADIDCRAFFDDEGHTYYRLQQKTVTVDPACHPLRKTDAEFFVDPVIRAEGLCTERNGRWTNNKCELCANGGRFERNANDPQSGFCIYQTISKPNESTSCAQQYNGCRAYSGNGVGNIQDSFFHDFEPLEDNAAGLSGALRSWSPAANLRVSSEATHTGKHSLQVAGGVTPRRIFSPGEITKDTWYQISFLAKSNVASSKILIQFQDEANNVLGSFSTQDNPVALGNGWQLYNLGPIKFTGTGTATTSLSFYHAQGDQTTYYIDQVRMRRLTDYNYFIKDSWKNKNKGLDVPIECDSAPEDRLPGEALGCREYTDSNGNNRFATGFESICREKAIGCQPVWDTFNTVNGSEADQAQAFNVVCHGAENATCTASYSNQELGNCFVQKGASTCFIPKIVVPRGMNFEALKDALKVGNSFKIELATSSISIPSDTPSTTPIFLAVGENGKFTCDSTERGCQKAGLEEKYLPANNPNAFKFNDIYIKNDPESYLDTLCRDDLVGCGKFRAGNKETYFKDPSITGNSLCVYKPASASQSAPYGWFLDGVGKCSTNNNTLCKEDADCTGANAKCIQKNTIACAADNLKAGGLYDIWSNSTPDKYKGNVGICPSEFNKCTELIDHQDTSTLNPDGKPYYVIYNQKLEDKQSECSQVSLNEGCVLFDKTDEPNKLYDSRATYIRSEKKVPDVYGLVDPATFGSTDFAKADSNIILKVNRDRDCSEWLACSNYVKVLNKDGSSRFVCQQVSACNEVGRGLNSDCAQPVGDLDSPLTTQRALFKLDYDHYITRPVSWYDEEFSGYSLYNKFQIANMIDMSFTAPDDVKNIVSMKTLSSKNYVVRELDEDILIQAGVNESLTCKRSNVDNTDWMSCGFDEQGMCYESRCIYPLSGSFQHKVSLNAAPDIKARQILSVLAELEANTCKGAPEEDSPYPYTILEQGDRPFKMNENENGAALGAAGRRRTSLDRVDALAEANFCQAGNCSCSYQKITYRGGQVDFWPTDPNLQKDENGLSVAPPQSICIGGTQQGLPCLIDANCGDKGICQPQEKTDDFIGLEGFCLEYDLSRKNTYNNTYSCLTWLPVQTSASPVDIYNPQQKRGYLPALDAKFAQGAYYGQAYCLKSAVEQFVPNQASITNEVELRHDANGRLPDENNFPPFDQEACSSDGGGFSGPATDFHGDFCNMNGDSSPEGARSFLENWFRKWADPSSVVLRLELPSAQAEDKLGKFRPLDSNDNDVTDSHISEAPDGCGGEGQPPCSLYGFAPIDFNNVGIDFGTLMHPPRLFNEGFSICDMFGNDIGSLDNCTNQIRTKKAYEIFNYNSNSASPRQIATFPLSPDALHFNFIHNPEADQLVYRSGQEEHLNRKELKRVYFVPTGFPWGAEGYNPALMTKEMFIDFAKADESMLYTNSVPTTEDIQGANNDTNFFPKPSEGESTNAIVYVINDVSHSDTSYKNYSTGNPQGFAMDMISGETVANKALAERNKIDKRYVLFFAKAPANLAGAGIPQISLQQNGPNQPATITGDPFSAECHPDTTNWFAVGMDFNKDDEFLGYISRWCNGTDGDGETDNGIQFAVVATKNDQCIDIKKVYRSENGIIDGTNKAWTNRVWQYGRDVNPLDIYASLKKSIRHVPFGSLSLGEQDLRVFAENPQEGSLQNIHYYFRKEKSGEGIPFACLLGNCSGLKTGRFLSYGALADTVNGKVDGNALQLLSNLFVHVYASARFDNLGQPLGVDTEETDAATLTLSAGETLTPPKIYSINPATCAALSTCSAAEEGNVTINEKNGYTNANATVPDYNGDGVPDEDSDGNNVADALLSKGGSFYADMKFFAFADDNRMPIRRLRVNWGDGSDESGGKFGFYPNYKPICDASAPNETKPQIGLCAIGNVPTGVTCMENEQRQVSCPIGQTCKMGEQDISTLPATYQTKRFGNDSERSCVEGFHEYVHEYHCGSAELRSARSQGGSTDTVMPVNDVRLSDHYDRLKVAGLQDGDLVCVYKPKVQALDNWGWCNGSCTKTYDPETGEAKPGPNGANMTNGCYSEFPVTVDGDTIPEDQCKESNEGRDPWSEYKGLIIVVPKSQI